jgi:predicted ATP-grasp superfamily ATP-dependent carboligase
MNGYTLSANSFAFSHDNTAVNLLRDLTEQPTPMDIESLVASGDLFAVLATELDDIALTLIEAPAVDVSSKLEKLTKILLYLQRHYKVSRKRPDRRQ